MHLESRAFGPPKGIQIQRSVLNSIYSQWKYSPTSGLFLKYDWYRYYPPCCRFLAVVWSLRSINCIYDLWIHEINRRIIFTNHKFYLHLFSFHCIICKGVHLCLDCEVYVNILSELKPLNAKFYTPLITFHLSW
jgi:hypothetical protein